MSTPVLDQALTFSSDSASQNCTAYFPASLRGQYVELIVYVKFSAGVGAGKIQIQTADQADYGGTWANVGSTIDWAAASATKYAAVTGVFGALRLNIDTAVTGGTVSAYVVGSAA